MIEAKIGMLRSYGNEDLIKGASYINALLVRVESHGGRILLINMTTTGFVREIEEKKFPHLAFLDVFEKLTGRKVFVANDSASLATYRDPDGSHLDMRDRAAFTAQLDKQLRLTLPVQK